MSVFSAIKRNYICDFVGGKVELDIKQAAVSMQAKKKKIVGRKKANASGVLAHLDIWQIFCGKTDQIRSGIFMYWRIVY